MRVILMNSRSDIVGVVVGSFTLCVLGLVAIIIAMGWFRYVTSSEKQSGDYEEVVHELSPDGYCMIKGGYRKRYVVCVGSPTDTQREAAKAKANECNTLPGAVSGCDGLY